MITYLITDGRFGYFVLECGNKDEMPEAKKLANDISKVLDDLKVGNEVHKETGAYKVVVKDSCDEKTLQTVMDLIIRKNDSKSIEEQIQEKELETTILKTLSKVRKLLV